MNLQSKNFPSRSRKEQLIDNDLQQLGDVVNGIIETPVDSADVSYDNTTSGLDATNVKTAIDKLAASSGGSDYTETIVNISAAQIKNNLTTPINVSIATLNSNQFLECKAYLIVTVGNQEFDFDTTPGLAFGFFVGTRRLSISNDDMNNFVGNEDTGTKLIFEFLPLSGYFQQGDFTVQSSDNCTNGNSTFEVLIYHKTITFGA